MSGRSDKKIDFVAVDEEEEWRVTVQAQLGLPINSTQVVEADWIKKHKIE